MSTSYQQRLGFYKGDRYIHRLGEENARRTSVFNALSNKRERDDNKIKSQMCSNLPNCRFGDKCRFAHSKDELRKPLCKFGDMCRFKDTCTFDHTPREVIPKMEKTPVKPSAAKEPKQERKPPAAPKEEFIIELEDSDEEEEEEEKYSEEEELIPTPDEKEKIANVPNSPTFRGILEDLARCYRSDDEVEEDAMKKVVEEAASAKAPKKITAAAETEHPVIQQAIRQPCGVLLPEVVPLDISEVKEESCVEEKSFGEDSVPVEPEDFLSSDENIIALHPQEVIANEAPKVPETKNEQENVEEQEVISGGDFSDISPFCQVLESPFYLEEDLIQTTLAEVFSDQHTTQHQDDLIYPHLDESFHNFTLGPSLYESLKHASTQELVQQIINQQNQIQIQQQKLNEQQTIIDSQTQLLYTPSIPIIVSPSLFYFIQQSGF